MTDLLSQALEAEVLAQDLHRFAERLRHLSIHAADEPDTSADWTLPERARGDPDLVGLAMTILRQRRLRATYLPEELLGEPVWDMLLDLFISASDHRAINVTSLSLASGQPSTTGLRYIALMEEHGLIERYAACHDRRVTYLRLTKDGAHRLKRYLHRVSEEGIDQKKGFLLHSVK